MSGIMLLLVVGVAAWLLLSGRLQRMNGLDGVMIGLGVVGTILTAKGRLLPGGTALAIALFYAWRILRSGKSPLESHPASFANAAKLVEARAILGLDEHADETMIRAAHRRLIARAHPDAGGTKGLAEKINEARAILLRHHIENKRSHSPEPNEPPHQN